MKQGTVSWLFGCHSIIHSFLVFRSWRILYGYYPSFKETVCIFLHDIGHLGIDYLKNNEEKKRHGILGAEMAGLFFGESGYDLVSGHCSYSGHEISKIYKADKYSWYIAPYWWLYWNNIIEPMVKQGMKNREAIVEFQSQVAKSIESGEFKDTHYLYLERVERRKNADITAKP
jgi:hypothetical protein